MTFPLDLTKTRLQIQGEAVKNAGGAANSQAYRGMIATIAGIGAKNMFLSFSSNLFKCLLLFSFLMLWF